MIGTLGCEAPSSGKKTSQQIINEQSRRIDAEQAKSEPTKNPNEDDIITVQHLLVSFGGAGTPATRSKAEAAEMAKSLFEEAKSTDDFPGMVKEFTDDAFPGLYQMANYQVVATEGDATGRVHRRTSLVPAFGNVGFKLKVGEVGLAEFDPSSSPYGWHIIKRTK